VQREEHNESAPLVQALRIALVCDQVLEEMSVPTLCSLAAACRLLRPLVAPALQSLPYVVLTGGTKPQGFPTEVHALNLVTCSFEALSSFPSSRHSHASCATADGTLLVLGGIGPEGTPVYGVKQLKEGSAAWSSAPGLPSPTFNLHAVAVAGRVLALGGFVEGRGETERVLEREGRRWRALPTSMLTPRCDFAVAAVGADVFIAGGSVGFRAEAEVLRRGAEQSEALPPLPFGRRGCAGASFRGSFVVLGGRMPNNITAQVLQYDQSSGTWRPLPPLPQPRHRLCAVEVGGLLLALGGCGPGGYQTDTVFVFDGERWRTLTLKLPAPLGSFSATLLPRRTLA